MGKTAAISKGGVGVNANVPKTDGAKSVAQKKPRKTSVLEFARQVRVEIGRITWPTRRETTITTIMVFVMVLFCSVFFLIADQIIIWGVRAILGG